MNREQVEKIIGHKFANKAFLDTAFVHSSYANEKSVESNERLEYLGDAVLELLVTDKLYKIFNLPEGKLTKYRASLVSEPTLSFVISQLGLDKFLLRGKGEQKTQPTSAEKCDLFEAVVGALYLDGGIEASRKFVDESLGDAIEKLKAEGLEENAKSMLQEMLKNQRIVYSTTKHGESHNPFYKCTVIVNGNLCGYGEGKNKKTAEQIAAKNTISILKKA
ncbi:MAG: ribonuclease III [Clostridia bacterium]|nr:ribonuclease III [Clostridia bacterium]